MVYWPRSSDFVNGLIGDMEPGDIEFAVMPKPATFDQKNPIVAVADALLRVTRPKGDLRRHNKDNFCLYFAFCGWDMRERDGTFKITLQEIVDE